jgi:hypothetical protein
VALFHGLFVPTFNAPLLSLGLYKGAVLDLLCMNDSAETLRNKMMTAIETLNPEMLECVDRKSVV